MSARKIPSETRFWQKVDKSGECWLWTASVIAGDRGGYGQFRSGGQGSKMYKAHVWAYEQLVGPVPEGMQLDHLCRVRACVNPDHLEPVTHAENQRRSPLTPSGKAECRRGHSLEDAYLSGGRRVCRPCALEKSRAANQTEERRAYNRAYWHKRKTD